MSYYAPELSRDTTPERSGYESRLASCGIEGTRQSLCPTLFDMKGTVREVSQILRGSLLHGGELSAPIDMTIILDGQQL
jgi:hypothetical protein